MSLDPSDPNKATTKKALESAAGSVEGFLGMQGEKSGARIPRDMLLRDHVERLEELSVLPVFQEFSVPTDGITYRANMYAYLRDNESLGLTTVGDALDAFQEGRIEEAVVRMWLEEKRFNEVELEAVLSGYPQLQQRAEELGLFLEETVAKIATGVGLQQMADKLRNMANDAT